MDSDREQRDDEVKERGDADNGANVESGEDNLAVDGMLRELARGGGGTDDVFVGRVLDSVSGKEPSRRSGAASEKDSAPAPIVEWSWLGGRRFWRIAATVVCLALGAVIVHSTRVLTAHADPTEVFLYSQEELAPGQPVSFRVFVRDGSTQRPIAASDVDVFLTAPDGPERLIASGTTGEDGLAVASSSLPEDFPEGRYGLRVRARSGAGAAEAGRNVRVRRSYRCLLSADKPLYQPGQTIHLRALTLATADLRPAAERPVVFEVADPKGNKVFKRKLETSAYGIAAVDFELADQVNEGTYTLAVTVGDTRSEKSVEVRRYVLPKYKVELVPEKSFYGPGERVRGRVRAAYTFGKPVADAEVELTASEFIDEFRTFASATGKTDADGSFAFELLLKDAFAGTDLRRGDAQARLKATVTDTAGHRQEKKLDVIVSVRPIRIELFPESGRLVRRVENNVFVVTTYPDGRPAQTRVTIEPSGTTLETSAAGIARYSITPQTATVGLRVAARDRQGLEATVDRKLRTGRQEDGVLLRTDRAVYQTGDTVALEVLGASSGRVFIDFVKSDRTILMSSVDLEDGRAELALDLAPDAFGTLELHAYRILSSGSLVRDSKVIQVNRASDLTIRAELDKETYRPGERAAIRFLVASANGDPVQSALSLSAVDEAVYALGGASPGLERLYFALQRELLEPRYEIHAHLPDAETFATAPGGQDDAESEERQAELREASALVSAVARGGSGPRRDSGEGFGARQETLREQKESFLKRLYTGGLLSPFVLLVLLILPLLIYAGQRFLRPRPIEDLDERAQSEFKRASRRLYVTWLVSSLGLVGAPLLAVFANERDLLVPLYGLGGLMSAALVGVFAADVRRNVVAQARPLLRKLAVLVPLATLAAWFAVGGIFTIGIYGFSNLEWGMAILALSVLGLTGLVAGALATVCTGAVRHCSPGRLLWVFGSRGLPILGVEFLLICAIALLSVRTMTAGRAGGMEMVETAMAVRSAPTAAVPAAAVPKEDAPGPAGEPPRIRRHFPETLLWVSELITDEKGEATLEVPLADSITTWRLDSSAVSSTGELGATTSGIRVFQDFFVDIDVPVALTQNDRVSLPVAVYNYLETEQTVRLELTEVEWAEFLDGRTREIALAPGDIRSVHFTVRALKPGDHPLTVKAFGTELSDAVERHVTVRPDGREVVETLNGYLQENLVRRLQIPDAAIDGSSDLFVKIYPGSFSQVVEGLENIFRMPYGCFEQTSSSTYPNVLVLDYMRSTKQISPEIEMRALQYINTGYQRLLSFEVPGGGFDWYGKAPANTVLSAYGLLEFSDMAKVYEIDPAVIDRTRTWLYEQQRADGTWTTARGFGGGELGRQVSALISTAYVAWALAETGDSDRRLGKALDWLAGQIATIDSTYVIALCANAFTAAKRPEAAEFFKKLAERQEKRDNKVWWTSTGQGATYSQGDVLSIEGTALVASALLQSRRDITTAHKALAWLVEQKDPHGTWYSTQATVQAIRVLLLGAGQGGTSESDLQVTVAANGKLAKEIDITKETSDVFRLISLRAEIQEGENVIALETSGKGDLAYQIVARHYLPWAESEQTTSEPRQDALEIDLSYNTTTLKVDETIRCEVSVQYNRPGVAPMTLVDLGVPPGFDVDVASFDELVAAGVIEKYSVSGRQVILYFRELQSGAPVRFGYRMRAKYPVVAKTPVSTAYQYYEPEVRATTRPVVLRVE